MKFNITLEQIEEVALCIVHCSLNEEDACDYARGTLLEVNGITNGVLKEDL
jgi:hypothetical protein